MHKTGKRILEVKIIREVDTDPDTSYLGEYSNSPDSDYSIDRKHTLECASLEHIHREPLDKLERVREFLQGLRESPEVSADPYSTEWEGLDAALDVIAQAQEDVQACDCDERGPKLSREYQYFNPNHGNYEGEPEEDVRKCCAQDFQRMEDYNNQQWCYIGIRAEARVQTATGSPVQTLHSGGLWGIESDSDESYFKEVGREELATLKDELKAMGFSARAIATAFKDAEEVDA